MGYPDPERSRAVFIGVSRYDTDALEQLPTVANNLRDLIPALTDTYTGVLSKDQCTVVHNPRDIRDISGPLLKAAHDASDLLLVYYAGHGLIGRHDRDLYLALSSSEPMDIEWTGLPYHLIRQAFARSKASVKVAILDSCYSGRALTRGFHGGAGLTACRERRMVL